MTMYIFKSYGLFDSDHICLWVVLCGWVLQPSFSYLIISNTYLRRMLLKDSLRVNLGGRHDVRSKEKVFDFGATMHATNRLKVQEVVVS